MTMPAIKPKEWLLLYLLSLFWGSSFLFYEFGLDGLPPLTIVAIRMTLGASFLFLLMGRRRAYLAQMRMHWVRCLGFGLLGAALPFSLFAYAQIHITSSMASVLNATMPLFTCACAVAASQEKFSLKRACGMMLGIIGVAILVGPAIEGNLAEAIGCALCLLAALCYAINTVLMRGHPGGMESAALALGMCTGAAVISCTAAALTESPDFAEAGWRALGGAAGLGLLGTALSYRIFFHLLPRIGASNTSLCVLLIPVNAIPLGAFVLGESLSLGFFVGAGTIIFSLALVDNGIGNGLARLAARWRQA